MADLNIQLTRGNDATILIPVLEANNDNLPLDMSAALGIVIVFYDSNNKPFAKYSKNLTGDFSTYSPIDVTDSVNGNLTIEIQAEQTIEARPGIVTWIFKITFTKAGNSLTDADYGFDSPQVFGFMNGSPLATVATH